MLWANAYNAALTGLLIRKTDQMTNFTDNDVRGITRQCKAFADQFLSDALALKTSSSGSQWTQTPDDGIEAP